MKSLGELRCWDLFEGELELPHAAVFHDEALGARAACGFVVGNAIDHEITAALDNVGAAAIGELNQAGEAAGVVQLKQ